MKRLIAKRPAMLAIVLRPRSSGKCGNRPNGSGWLSSLALKTTATSRYCQQTELAWGIP